MKVRLNIDPVKVKEIRQAIKNNQGYCPCVLEKTSETKCPCLDFRENQECHCGLYEKVEDSIND